MLGQDIFNDCSKFKYTLPANNGKLIYRKQQSCTKNIAIIKILQLPLIASHVLDLPQNPHTRESCDRLPCKRSVEWRLN
jgi:hypothetical protein